MKSILLINLGTPAAPSAPAVRRYLAEFLADPRVVPLPRWLWLPLLHGVVLPLRAPQSAHKYAQIWMAEGSPLAVYTARMAALLAERLERPVRYAMRYGAPAIASALSGLVDPVVVPLYPQYAASTTGSVLDVLPRNVPVVRGFHDHPAYVAALAARVRRHWDERGRGLMLLMSFHGLPQRAAGDYERECRATAALLARALGLRDSEWRVTFQSRFGYARWLEPYTEQTMVDLARDGLRRVDVICPGFVADCLETLEEIGIRARQRFEDAGGESLELVPCLNDSPEWIGALAEISARASP
ncbi:MAG TPA: ferrochelatase [Burkholderiales bacterium]|nr:ferrochelatase [Burkholderiales bacterium]